MGLAFYQAGWVTVEPRVMRFLYEFDAGLASLDCLNWAYMVLLPKTTNSRTPSSFRPICLQNCPMKIVSKILTTRLQMQIAQLIDMDQTGFLQGRSISENFIYAMELV